MTIDYDASALSGWTGLPRLFMRYNGTILSATLLGPLFWITQMLHIGLLILNGRIPIGRSVPVTINGTKIDGDFVWTPYFEPIELPILNWGTALVGLPLLFFFIVFYNNNSYQRFYQLYGHTVGMGGKVMEWTSLVKSHSLGETAEHRWAQWHSVRLMLAGMNILYYSLFGTGVDKDEWKKMNERDLLTEDECRILRGYKGFAPFLAVYWALDEAKSLISEKALHDESYHHDLGQGMRDEMIHEQFRQCAFEFRGHCGQIVNLLKQPVPFPYFHLLSVMLLIQLLLLAYTLACTANSNVYFSIPVMIVVSIVLIGMRGLAVQLSNPFGEDSVDFDIEKFMSGAKTNAIAHLNERERRVHGFAEPRDIQNPLRAGPRRRGCRRQSRRRRRRRRGSVVAAAVEAVEEVGR